MTYVSRRPRGKHKEVCRPKKKTRRVYKSKQHFASQQKLSDFLKW